MAYRLRYSFNILIQLLVLMIRDGAYRKFSNLRDCSNVEHVEITEV
jgi:hypothetical protein